MQKIIMQALDAGTDGITYNLPECQDNSELAHDAFQRHRAHHAALAEAGFYGRPFALTLFDSAGRELIRETIVPAPL